MHPLSDDPKARDGSFLVPATVAEAAEKQWCRIFQDEQDPDDAAWARIALAGGASLREGDRVLAAWPAAGPRYVIGVLEEAPRPAATAEVVASDGASARRTLREAEEVLELRDAAGRVLFEYRPGTGLATVYQPSGSLRLAAPEGDIELAAGRHVELRGAEGLALRSAGRVCVEGAGTGGRSALHLDGSRAALSADALELTGRRTVVRAEDLDVSGESARARFGRTSLAARVVEVTAERLLQRAKAVHQRIEDLLDVTVRRARTAVAETLRTRAGRVDVIAEGRVRIDGEKIHLG